MFAKRFFYVCAGILCLALAYHLGARTAGAQAGSTMTGVAVDGACVYMSTPNGDIYIRPLYGTRLDLHFQEPPYLAGNFWGSGPTPLRQESWGSVKARYRGERQPATETERR